MNGIPHSQQNFIIDIKFSYYDGNVQVLNSRREL